MRSIVRKSLLYKSGVEYSDYCINHVEGCSHGCRYPCYAMMLKKRCGVIKNYNDWIKPKLVSNALELLENEIPKYKKDIKFVHLCFSTDPFMYKYPEVKKLTLAILERLNKDNIRSVVLTKGVYPKVLKNTIKYGSNNEYGTTLISLNDDYKKRFEPYSAPFRSRIRALKHLNDNGLKTWISMEPYPTPNLIIQNLKNILNKISFVDKIVFGKLNYNVEASKYVGYKEFYDECSNVVNAFCERRNIECHIKYGTQKKDIKKTSRLFNTERVLVANI
ncbi:radical SAM protein [Patescibacteria group bacterium]|nr:radical SAM protein [Patescibacteria group bacterium]MBU1890155.1 radical SAM protein [Patescibacteria group bacterium]